MNKSTLMKRAFLFAIVAMMGFAKSYAADIDYWTQGVIKCVIKGSGADYDQAAMVCVSSTQITNPDDIAPANGNMTLNPVKIHGASGTAAVNQSYYFYVKPNPGYVFLGFASTKTGTPSGAMAVEKLSKVGDYYYYTGKVGAGYSANTEGKPKVYTRYAVFEEKVEDSEPTGTGAAFVSASIKGIEGLSFSEGSMTSKPTVLVTFAEPVNYTSAPGYGEIPSCINKDVVKYVSVTCNETNQALTSTQYTISASATYVEGIGDMGDENWTPGHYENGVGAIQLPMDIKKGTYTIHLPFGLYTTTGDNGMSNACDIIVTVTEAQQIELKVKSTSPSEGQEWDAFEGSGSTANNNYNGLPGQVTIIFDQLIDEVIPGKTPTLVKTTNNHSFPCLGYKKATLQTAEAKATLNISFQQIPSGTYKVTVPAGIVKTATGVYNNEIVINFSVKDNGYVFDEWTLPEYKATVTPGNYSHMKELKTITVSLEREGFAAPVAIKGNPVIKFQDYYEDWSGIDPEAAEARPQVVTTDLDLAYTTAVNDGKVVITLDKTYGPDLVEGLLDDMRTFRTLLVSIPADIVYNVEDGASKTIEELCIANACKSPAMTVKMEIGPDLKFIDDNAEAYNINLGVTTFVSPADFDMTQYSGIGEIKAYTIDGFDTDNVLTMTEVEGTVPANTPVVMFVSESIVDFCSDGANSYLNAYNQDAPITTLTPKAGMLVGSYSNKFVAPQGTFVLQNNDDKVGFYYVTDGVAPHVKRGHAYLTAPEANAKMLAFPGNTATSINAIFGEKNVEIFDLQGRKLSHMQKGLNIVNGVKVMVK